MIGGALGFTLATFIHGVQYKLVSLGGLEGSLRVRRLWHSTFQVIIFKSSNAC
jgi:hypothetical protein